MQAIREFRCWRGFEFVANAGQREINAESFVTGEHDADVQSRVGSESGAALMLRYFLAISRFPFPLRRLTETCLELELGRPILRIRPGARPVMQWPRHGYGELQQYSTRRIR